MKAVLKFHLPEEHDEHQDALRGGEWKAVCYEVDQLLRDHLKYGHEFTTASEAFEHTRKALHDFMEAYGLIFD